jgi:hypothetical protein
MKKLHTFALLNLLATGYITHASNNILPDQVTEKEMHNKNKKKLIMDKQVAAAIGSPLNYIAIADYTINDFATSLIALSANSTPTEKQIAMTMLKNIKYALKKLNPTVASDINNEPADVVTQTLPGVPGTPSNPWHSSMPFIKNPDN